MSQNLNSKNVVVTGAAGYVGGITSIELKRKGYNVFGVDRRHLSHLDGFFEEYYCGDLTDYETFLMIKRVRPAAIVHCAGTSLVGPSMLNPAIYFDNNVSRTNRLLKFLIEESFQTKFIFSSSAAVYGNWSNDPYREYSDKKPVSPYGDSKLMVEKILDWYKVCHKLKFVALRYFNACGADPYAVHGQEPDATHIFAQLFKAANNDTSFNLNGSSYHTKDGTCIRDYIHVSDIADAHIKSIETDIEGCYNIGTLKGTSNLDCLQHVENILKKEIVVTVGPAREGDPGILIADPTKFQIATHWSAWRTLPMIVKHLRDWYNSETYKSLINNKRS
ncbi:MAG: UDP-glucose 4-epimerase [Proteobacteria bacterium]|nr:UDP-glucose 4-epimerase [Pseudomonadota bacterium]NBP14487.1 UDP-glucose 4-epimerase [bacterium]